MLGEKCRFCWNIQTGREADVGEGATPLHISAQHANRKIVRYLLSVPDVIDVFAEDSNGRNVLHRAVTLPPSRDYGDLKEFERIEIIRMLLSEHSRLVASETSVVDCAILSGLFRCAYELTDHYHISPTQEVLNLVDHRVFLSGESRSKTHAQRVLEKFVEFGLPLSYDSLKSFEIVAAAVRKNDIVALRTLVDAGVDPNVVHPETGENGLMVACGCLHDKIVRCFVEEWHTDVALRDKTGWTALHHFAAENGNADAGKFVKRKAKTLIADLFAQQPDSGNLFNPLDGPSLLQIGLSALQFETISLLLDRGSVTAMMFEVKPKHCSIAQRDSNFGLVAQAYADANLLNFPLEVQHFFLGVYKGEIITLVQKGLILVDHEIPVAELERIKLPLEYVTEESSTVLPLEFAILSGQFTSEKRSLIEVILQVTPPQELTDRLSDLLMRFGERLNGFSRSVRDVVIVFEIVTQNDSEIFNRLFDSLSEDAVAQMSWLLFYLASYFEERAICERLLPLVEPGVPQRIFLELFWRGGRHVCSDFMIESRLVRLADPLPQITWRRHQYVYCLLLNSSKGTLHDAVTILKERLDEIEDPAQFLGEEDPRKFALHVGLCVVKVTRRYSQLGRKVQLARKRLIFEMMIRIFPDFLDEMTEVVDGEDNDAYNAHFNQIMDVTEADLEGVLEMEDA